LVQEAESPQKKSEETEPLDAPTKEMVVTEPEEAGIGLAEETDQEVDAPTKHKEVTDPETELVAELDPTPLVDNLVQEAEYPPKKPEETEPLDAQTKEMEVTDPEEAPPKLMERIWQWFLWTRIWNRRATTRKRNTWIIWFQRWSPQKKIWRRN
jgi:hypothetical protein